MSQQLSTPWQRIEAIMYQNGFRNASSFARHIGLNCVETLSQIRRGNNNISLKLAAKISAAFPDIDEGYLLTGKKVCGTAQIPYYITDTVNRFRNKLPPDNYIGMPFTGVPDLAFATVNNEPEPIEGALLNAVLIVEEVSRNRFALDRPHLIETENILILRFIGDDEETGHYRLYSDNKAKPVERIIEAAQIISLFALRYVINIY